MEFFDKLSAIISNSKIKIKDINLKLHTSDIILKMVEDYIQKNYHTIPLDCPTINTIVTDTVQDWTKAQFYFFDTYKTKIEILEYNVNSAKTETLLNLSNCMRSDPPGKTRQELIEVLGYFLQIFEINQKTANLAYCKTIFKYGEKIKCIFEDVKWAVDECLLSDFDQPETHVDKFLEKLHGGSCYANEHSNNSIRYPTVNRSYVKSKLSNIISHIQFDEM